MGINPMTFQTAAMQATARSGSPRRAVRSVKRRAKKATSKVRRKVKRASSKVKAKFTKGSAAAKAHMAKLRRMQKRK